MSAIRSDRQIIVSPACFYQSLTDGLPVSSWLWSSVVTLLVNCCPQLLHRGFTPSACMVSLMISMEYVSQLLSLYVYLLWHMQLLCFRLKDNNAWLTSLFSNPEDAYQSKPIDNVVMFHDDVNGPLCGEFTGPGEFPTQRPVTRSFDVFFDLHLNKRLSKQWWCWWFETPSWSLWR